jgi:hypothetical protein
MNDEAMLFLESNPDGTYKLAQQRFELDEDWETESSLVNVTKERAKVVIGGQLRMMTIFVENVAGMRLPHIRMSELEG